LAVASLKAGRSGYLIGLLESFDGYFPSGDAGHLAGRNREVLDLIASTSNYNYDAMGRPEEQDYL